MIALQAAESSADTALVNSWLVQLSRLTRLDWWRTRFPVTLFPDMLLLLLVLP